MIRLYVTKFVTICHYLMNNQIRTYKLLSCFVFCLKLTFNNKINFISGYMDNWSYFSKFMTVSCIFHVVSTTSGIEIVISYISKVQNLRYVFILARWRYSFHVYEEKALHKYLTACLWIALYNFHAHAWCTVHTVELKLIARDYCDVKILAYNAKEKL